MPDKGLTTAQLKKLYMKNLKGKQAAEQKGISSKNFVRMYMAYNGDANTSDINKAVNRLEGIREESVYKPQREKASARFDKNTKFDDLLGRSTNPYKKFDQGGIMKSKKKMPKYNAGGYNDPEKLKKMAKSAFNALTGVSGVKAAASLANKVNGGNVFQRAGYDVSKAAGSAATGAAAGATMGKMTKTVEKKPAPMGRMKELFEESASKGSFSKSLQRMPEKGIAVKGKPVPRVTSKPSKGLKEIKFDSYRYGGKVYKDGGRALFEALKKKFGEG